MEDKAGAGGRGQGVFAARGIRAYKKFPNMNEFQKLRRSDMSVAIDGVRFRKAP